MEPLWLLFYHAVPLSLGIRNKTFIFKHHCKGRTERSDITCFTSQANKQADDLMVDVTLHESSILIQSSLIAHPNTTGGSQVLPPFAERKGLITLYTFLFQRNVK